MTKVMVLLSRRADLSPDAFHRHWREVHRPLIERLPGIRRLVLNHVQPDPQGNALEYDGIGESWYDSPAAMQLAFASPEAQAVFADTLNFVDVARLRVLVVEEEAALVATEPMVGVAGGIWG